MKFWKRIYSEFQVAAWAYVAATLVIALGLAVFSFFGLIYFNLNHFTQKVAQELALNIYLEPKTTLEKAQKLIAEIKKEPLVAKVTYLPPEEVLEDLKEVFEEKDLLEGISTDFLPPVLVVSFKDPFKAGNLLEKLSARLASFPGVFKVQFARSWLARLANLKRFLEIISLWGLFLVGVATCFIIGLVVRFSLSQRREELEVLSLVGATPGFIQGPILTIAAFQGFFASVVAFFLVYVLKIYLDRALQGFFPGLSGGLVFWNAKQLAILISGVIFLCVTGSYWASRRYLRY